MVFYNYSFEKVLKNTNLTTTLEPRFSHSCEILDRTITTGGSTRICTGWWYIGESSKNKDKNLLPIKTKTLMSADDIAERNYKMQQLVKIWEYQLESLKLKIKKQASDNKWQHNKM